MAIENTQERKRAERRNSRRDVAEEKSGAFTATKNFHAFLVHVFKLTYHKIHDMIKKSIRLLVFISIIIIFVCILRDMTKK